MSTTIRAALIALAALIGGCAGSPTAPDRSVTFAYDFNDPPHQWTSDKVDIAVSLWREFSVVQAPLPDELQLPRLALKPWRAGGYQLLQDARVRLASWRHLSCVIHGGDSAVLTAIAHEGVPALASAEALMAWLAPRLTRPHDRAVFDLEP
jgi:hypothetical protein